MKQGQAKPGPQNPGKYPIAVGPNYLKYGEQPGYIYIPQYDKYFIDPRTIQTQLENEGLVEKEKKSGLGDALLPIATIAATPVLAKEVASYITGSLAGGAAAAGTAGAAAGAAGGAAAGGIAAPTLISAAPVAGEAAGAAGAATGSAGLLGIGALPAAGIAAGAALVGKGAYDLIKGKKTEGLLGWGGRIGLGMATGGLSEVARPFLSHKSTKERTKDRYGGLLGLAAGNQGYEQAVQKGQEESLAGTDVWDIGDDPTKAPIDLMTRSYGVLKTFGPEWMSYSPSQQQAIVQELVNQGKLNSKQGDYLIDDPEGAKAIAAQVAGGPAGSAFDASGKRLRPWQPGDPIYGGQ